MSENKTKEPKSKKKNGLIIVTLIVYFVSIGILFACALMTINNWKIDKDKYKKNIMNWRVNMIH